MTPWQCRAARDVLGWSIHRLSGPSCVSYESIKNLEGGGSVQPRLVDAVRAILESEGVFPMDDGGIEVRRHPGYGVIRIYREDGDAGA